MLFGGEWQQNSCKREFPELSYGETARGVVKR
jgi:hypothetical protein